MKRMLFDFMAETEATIASYRVVNEFFLAQSIMSILFVGCVIIIYHARIFSEHCLVQRREFVLSNIGRSISRHSKRWKNSKQNMKDNSQTLAQ